MEETEAKRFSELALVDAPDAPKVEKLTVWLVETIVPLGLVAPPTDPIVLRDVASSEAGAELVVGWLLR